jgi:membrane protein
MMPGACPGEAMSFTTIRLREAWNWGGLSAVELVKRTWAQMERHDTLNRAAVVAYYAMLALVPCLGFILAIALGAADQISNEIRRLSHEFLPSEAEKLIQDELDKIRTAPATGVLSFGFLVLLWSTSSLFAAIMDATNACYGVQDHRPWWKRRLIAIVLTVVEGVLFLGAALSILLWPKLLGFFGLSTGTAILASVVQWLVVVIMLLSSFAIAYYFSPDVQTEWEWITPGSALGVILLVLMTLGFRFYVQYGSSYSETYGALAGVIVTLLWFYLAALALLLGAEVNSVIEHAAPHGKAPCEKETPPQHVAG